MNERIFLLLTAAILAEVSGFRETYRAAVVEYHPIRGTSDEHTATVNLEKYVEFMKEAKKKGAQIIVFPENGLLTETASPIPSPTEGIAPWKNDFISTKIVVGLSLASKENSIYSVVNLPEKSDCEPSDSKCPSAGYYVYNTNVVFDRQGIVKARYRKYNLFNETSDFNQPEKPEASFFDTDFNVRFGTITSYDLLFASPGQNLIVQYGITDFVCPTLWFGELPFLTALQAQRGWAESNNVNLLSAGMNDPRVGSTGSGIYNGKYGQIAEVSLETGMNKLIVADVPKIHDSVRHTVGSRSLKSPTTAVAEPEDNSESGLNLRQDDMTMYTSEVIEGETFEKKICRGDFCCHFVVTRDLIYTQYSRSYSIRAVVSNGVRYFGKKFRGGVQSCGVVVCDGPLISDCTNRTNYIPEVFRFKEISIRGDFNRRNTFQMPSTLTDGEKLEPLSANKYEFVRREGNRSVEVTLDLVWPVTDLRTFGIWGRNFVRDMEKEYPVAGSIAILPTSALLGASVAFFLFAC